MRYTASLDHFAGEMAILFVDDLKIELPRKLLPDDIKPGNWIDINLEKNNGKTEEVRENIENLLDDLKKGDHLNDTSQE